MLWCGLTWCLTVAKVFTDADVKMLEDQVFPWLKKHREGVDLSRQDSAHGVIIA